MDEMREQIIKKDKAWLVSTLNSAGDAIMTCEMDDRLDFANAEALKILGLSLSEILGKSFQDVFKILRDGYDEPVQFWTNDQDDRMLASSGLPRGSFYLKPNGEKCYLSAHLSPLLSDNWEYMGKVIVFRDISKIIEAENTIKKERNNLKMMFDLLPTSMLVIDDDFIIQRVNRAFLKTFDLEKSRVIGKVFGDALRCVICVDEGCGYSLNCKFCSFRKIVSRVHQDKKMVRDRSIKVNFYNGNKQQSRFLNMSVLPVITFSNSEYIITIEDITEQIYYEKSLKEARESSLSILDSLPVMIYRIDHHHHCDFINQTFKTFMNITRESFIEAMKTHMQPEDRQRFIDTLKTSLRKETYFDIELDLLSPENTYRTFRGIGRPYFDKNQEYAGMIGLFLDIDDERFAEELFIKSQKKYFSLFKNMENSISYYKALYDEENNLIDAVLVEMNLATEKRFDTKRDEVIGHKLSEMTFLEKAESRGLLKRFEEVLALGKNVHIEEYYMRKLNRWVEGSIYSPEDGYIAILASDIDLKKKTELKLILAIKRSEEANRAKSEFLANMSHEIRTPLNGIVGMIDLTALEPLSDEQKDNLGTAKGCVQSLMNIINDILDFAKIEAGKLMINPMSFNLMDLIESTIKTYKKHAIEKCLDISVDYKNLVSLYVIGDSMRLKQIFNNLISNAIKFTNEGSIKVIISQELIPDETEEVMQEISITDTGIGIDPENYSMLFKSFTQIDGSYTREYGGTGLGLVITKQLVEMMGGTVSFTSQLGAGSTFTIRLPMVITQKPGETAKNTNPEVSFAGSRVLLVEDDRVNQIVISKMLESFGADVDVAANGVEGVKAASQKNYDIILMDVQMPMMDGIKATQIIQGMEEKTKRYFEDTEMANSRNLNTPIIALTAFALKGDEAIFKASGMDGYLSKPLDRHQMQILLKKYLTNQDESKTELLEDMIKGLQKKAIGHAEADESTSLTVDDTEKQEVNQKIENLKMIMNQGNYMLMEVIAHQLKGIFERMNAEELKNLVFKMELEIRKDRIENVLDYLERIEQIWLMMNNCE